MMRWMGWMVAIALVGCGPAPDSAGAAGRAAKWVMLGDSITHLAFSAAPALPGAPAFVEAGVPGATSTDGVARVADLIAANPDARGVALAYGTNDVLLGNTPDDFRAMMAAAVDRAESRGKAVMLARIPWGSATGLARVPDFNQVVDALAAQRHLAGGPDLYAWFQAHPEQLQADGIHPNADGQAAVRALWARAIAASGR